MKPRKFSKLGPESQAFILDFAEKYPGVKTIKGRLFQECLSGESYWSRQRAASSLCLMGYKRGLNSFKRIVAEFEQKWIATGIDRDNLWSIPTEMTEEANFVDEILMLIGMMNTAEAHVYLCSVFENSPSARLRSGAVDAMGYEEDFFDRKIILSILKQNEDWFVCCALWVFLMQMTRVRGSYSLMVEYVVPHLQSRSPLVRHHALDILAEYPKFKPVIRPLVNDPDEQVATRARVALTNFE